jgi:hypothetical protein
MAAVAVAGSAGCAAVAHLTGWPVLLALPAVAAVGWTTSRIPVTSGLPLRAASSVLAIAACALGTLLAEIAVLAAGSGTGPAVILANPGIVLHAYAGAVSWNVLFWALIAVLGAIPTPRPRLASSAQQAQQHAPQSWTPAAPAGEPGATMTGLTSPRAGPPPSLAASLDASRARRPATEPGPHLPPDTP